MDTVLPALLLFQVATTTPTPPPETPVEPPPARVLRLADAVQATVDHQPLVVQARAETRVYDARAREVEAGLYPQVNLTASYQRVRSAGIGGRNGAVAGGTNGGTPTAVATTTSTSGVDIWTFGGSATQLIWDFGYTSGRWRSAQTLADSFRETEKTAVLGAIATTRRDYFAARAQKALVLVARETLTNFDRHLTQIKGFVDVGTRPEIDLAQAKTDVANARVSLITADNAYAVAKARLAKDMNDASTGAEWDVADDELPPIEGEDGSLDGLVNRAYASRPEIAAYEKQREAQKKSADAYRGAYLPALVASGGASETGTALDELGPAWNIGIALNWAIFQGGLTKAQVREAEANADFASAEIDQQKAQVRLDVQNASLSLKAAKATVAATDEALANAQVRLRLAEGRYASGVGSIIELGDAQLAVANASAQRVQAQFQTASARADLLAAMGQR